LEISFFMISISFLFKILTNFTIYYQILETKQVGLVTMTYQTLRSSDTLFFMCFLAYRLLTLLGLFMLYHIYEKKQSITNLIIVVYLIIMLTYFSHSAYYIFHITSLLFLALITIKYHLMYKKYKVGTTKLLTYSFAVIGISQILFVFIMFNELLYVTAEIVQLIGYSILLLTFITVLRHGKKKK
ncbi:MAG: hypothetical protein ABIJ08_05800, partial [Nanoarchaeota archaeon]